MELLDTSVTIAEYMAATDECEAAFKNLYKARKKRPLLDIMKEVYVAFVDIPDTAGDNTAGATVPPLAPRIMALDIFWVSMRNPVDTAKTILHELVHLLDFSYLPEKEWAALSMHEREVRADDTSQICYEAFITKIAETALSE